ncbi:MAG: C25 family cysteine peptidase [Vicinamibacteria bacterium]
MPTGLNANGTFNAVSSQLPPGWFVLRGTDGASADGEVVHQIRLFIEVTGTTLEILVFDPGTSGAFDYNLGDNDFRTTYQLLGPCTTLATCGGAALATVNNLNNSVDELRRFAPTGFFDIDSGAGGNVGFTGLTPGVYEFRITSTANSDEGNVFGVDVRQGMADPSQPPAASDPHYNVFTIGRTANPDTTMQYGAAATNGTRTAQVSAPMTFYPYVDRGCQVFSSNFDMDDTAGGSGAGATGSILDALGATTSLDPMSGNNVHEEDTVGVEPTTGFNERNDNYGLYRVDTTPGVNAGAGAQQNFIDWRFADLALWTTNPANFPRNPANPIRTYLPNGYSVALGTATPTAPVKPTLTTAFVWVSGPATPTAGQTTRLAVAATLRNPAGGATLSNPVISIGVPASVANPALAIDTAVALEPWIDATATTCTASTLTTSLAACTINGTLAAGQIATLVFEVTLDPGTATSFAITGEPTTAYPPANATSWGSYTPFGAASAWSEYLGPLCALRADTTTALTRATVRGIRIEAAGRVRFATGFQRGTTGFRLYGVADHAGQGARVPLTADIVRAERSDSQRPQFYDVHTAPIGSPYVLVEELETDGGVNLLGPFAVGDERLERQYDRIAAVVETARWARQRRATEGEGARRSEYRGRRQGRARGAGGAGVVIEIDESGTLRVPWAELRAAGAPARPRIDRLRLSREGQNVAFQLERDGSGAPWALAFEAEGSPTAYDGGSVYLLTWSGEIPELQAPLTRWAEAPAPGFRRAERDSYFVASVPEGSDPWVWDLVFGDGTPWPYDEWSADWARFDLPGLPAGLAGDVPVRIGFVRASFATHDLRIRINGQEVARTTLRAAGELVIDGWLPAEALHEAGNTIEIVDQATGAFGADYPGLYLDFVDLGIPQPPAREIAPVAVRRWDPTLARGLRKAEYLIVTHPDFVAAAERIARAKEADGFEVAVVDVERAYDRFSGGHVEAAAVRELVRHAARGGRLRYVLLLGDDSYDPTDREGLGLRSFLPSLYGWDAQWGRVVSENLYADLDADGRPDVAIGRLPASTAEEADALAAKLERGAAVLASAATPPLFAVDNGGRGISFRSLAEEAAAAYGVTPEWAEISDGLAQARARLTAALRAGGSVHYFGHGGAEQWADEGLLTTDAIAAVAGGNESLVLAWACLSQWYQYPYAASVGEALVLLPNGGAVASFGPAGISDAGAQAVLARELYARLRPGVTLGDAIRDAKAAASAAPNALPAVLGFNLLGDPALRLP